MKKYTFKIIEDDTGIHISRHNEGFTIHELMTYVDDLKMDLLSVWKDILKGCIKKRVTFDTGEKSGEIDKEKS